jgi:hypothetical protein
MSTHYYVLCAPIKNVIYLDTHGRNTRYGSNFHYPTSNLALYQKSTYFMRLKVFNSLPSDIKDEVHDIKNIND